MADKKYSNTCLQLFIIELDQQHLYPTVFLGKCFYADAWHTYPKIHLQVLKSYSKNCQVVYQNDIQFGNNTIQR